MNSKQLLTALTAAVRETLAQTQKLDGPSDKIMNQQPAAGGWSVAQVLAHLNSYNRFYLPQITQSLQGSRYPATTTYKPGFFGNYFTKMMQPPNPGQAFKKYKAPKDHTPPQVLDAQQVCREFLQGQERLLALLQNAARHDLGKIKVPVSISRYIRLKLGDTFRFLIAHQQRHFEQIDRVLQGVQAPAPQVCAA